MSIDLLFADFDRLIQSAESVHRLRRFILDLAVRGKLAPQDPNDEPASELLKRIAAEKARLVKAGAIGKPKQLPAIDEPPYPIPDSWRWLPIRAATSDRAQCVPQTAFTYIDVTAIDKEKGFIAKPKVLQANEAPSRARKIVRKGDVVYSCVRPYLLNVAVVGEDFDPLPIASTAFAVLYGHGLVLPWFQWIVLRSPFMVTRVEEEMRGQAYPAINDSDFARLPFPLPPLAEQHLIVAKVNELMALCDRLEAARAEREATRDRLATASLSGLNAPDPEPTIFQRDVAFALNNLTPLTTRPDQIKALRQTILNLAVRGKLLVQEASEGDVDDLLDQLSIQRKRLIARKKLKRSVVTCNLENQDNLASIPNSWRWVPLGKLISFGPQNGISPRATNSTDTPRAITLTATTSGTFDASHFKHVEADVPADSEYWLRDGDLLFQRGNTREYVGIAAYFSGASGIFLYPDLIIKVRLLNGLYLPYVHLALVSPGARTYFSTNATGAQETMPKINQQTLLNAPVPLPPLAEQHRIVTKVDELMALCDRLEASLVTGGEARGRLVEAVLYEPLAAGGDRRRTISLSAFS